MVCGVELGINYITYRDSLKILRRSMSSALSPDFTGEIGESVRGSIVMSPGLRANAVLS